MRKTIVTTTLATVAAFSALFGNTALAHEVSNAKAAELSLHRVERLVILRKIEEGFETKARNLALSLIPHDDEAEPSFQATVSQWPGTDGTQRSVEIVMNAEGKTLKHTVVAGAEPANAPVWPDKDAVTLAENALHYVIEGAVTKPEVVPFNENLTGFTLSQETNAEGAAGAVVDFRSSADARVLRVRVKADGTFDSAELITPPAEGGAGGSG